MSIQTNELFPSEVIERAVQDKGIESNEYVYKEI